jgi:DNA-binding NarL/FixJ family response regulator
MLPTTGNPGYQHAEGQRVQVARQLIGTASTTKVVFISLKSDKETIEETRRYGHGYVFKPRLEPDLVTALDAAMRGEFFASDFGG